MFGTILNAIKKTPGILNPKNPMPGLTTGGTTPDFKMPGGILGGIMKKAGFVKPGPMTPGISSSAPPPGVAGSSFLATNTPPRSGNLASALGTPNEGGGVLVGRPSRSIDEVPEAPIRTPMFSTKSDMPGSTPYPVREPMPELPPPALPTPLLAPRRPALATMSDSPAEIGAGTIERPVEKAKLDARTITDYRGNEIKDNLGFRRDQYVREAEEKNEDGQGTGKFKRRGKDILRNMALGFLGAAANDKTGNPLAAGLGGMAAGGVGTGISPKMGREFSFSQMEEPRILGEEERLRNNQNIERKETLADMEIEKAKLQMEQLRQDASLSPAEKKARIAELEARTERAREEAKRIREGKPTTVRPPAPRWQAVVGPNGQPMMVDLNDPQNDGRTFQPYYQPRIGDQPKPMTQADAEAEIINQDNATPEQIAQSSMKWWEDEVKKQMPADLRAALENPAQADPETLKNAQAMYKQMIDPIAKKNLDYTKSEMRRKAAALRARGGATNAAKSGINSNPAGTPAPKAKLRDLKNLLK